MPTEIPKLNVSIATSSPERIKDRMAYYASFYGVSESLMSSIVNCENKDLDPLLQSYHRDPTGPNGREDSWGLVQIHLPSHSEVSKEEAQDVDFSLDFLARNLKEDRGYLWTCFSMLLGLRESNRTQAKGLA